MSLTIRTNAGNQTEYGIATVSENGKSIFAGNMKPENENAFMDRKMEQKRGFAQKQAMKLIGEAWGRDTQAVQSREALRLEKEEKLSELSQLQAGRKNIEDRKAALQEQYGVDPDSQEQKDLELLERFQNYKNGGGSSDFTKEEIERLSKLQTLPRTEYQKEVLAINDSMGSLTLEEERLKKEIIGLTQSETDGKLAQLKSQDMLKAQDAAGEVLDAADKEIFGELLQQGVEHIEETQEEIKEAAEEAQEKKEEQQERVEKAKEYREEQKEILEGAAETEKMDTEVKVKHQSVSKVEAAQKNIQKILEENHLVDEDLKGIEIDFNF